MADDEVVPRGFRARFDELMAAESRKDALMVELLDRFDAIQVEHEIIASDLDIERKARRELYGEVQSLAEQKKMMDRAQFVLVLIDADADRYLFHEKFLERGEKGGQDAAAELMRKVKEHLSLDLTKEKDVPVIVKAYANLAGLAQACAKNDKLKNVGDVNLFFVGFTRKFPQCDFIDVGYGREEADNKIRNVLLAYVDNPLCQHILLGCCHDSGYVPVLREWEAPSPVSKRITLIKGGPLMPQMENLAFSKTGDLDSVFCSKSSTVIPGASPLAAAPPKTQRNRRASATETNSMVKVPNRLGPIVRNEFGQRIDRELHVNEKLLEAIKPSLLCPWYYLRGECTGTCGRNHKYPRPLKEPEFNVVWSLARLGQCYSIRKGKDCIDDKCVYGHHSA